MTPIHPMTATTAAASTVRVSLRAGRFIAGHPHATIDYVKICDTTTVRDVARMDGECVMALAVRVGVARLIDNYVFGESLNV